ncbi:cholesterol 24-hydroxylase-like [Lineus longissimus]|uniref:cholesterol 24-hydroxylase-like n=1 Tax=Lineus longissimus TaxID=88925 RepID=UPI002B4F7417
MISLADMLLNYGLAMVFLVFILATVSICSIIYLIFLHIMHKRYAHIPSPKRASFILGHLPLILTGYKKGSYFVEILRQWIEENGDTIAIFMLHRVFVVTVDPYSVRDLMVTGGHPKDPDSYKVASYLFGERFLGNGLATSTDFIHWAHRRTIIAPAFHRRLLLNHINDFNQGADRLMSKLRSMASKDKPVKMLHQFNRAALDIIGKVAFGMDVDSLHNECSPFPNAIHTAMEGFSEYTKNPLSGINPFLRSFHKDVRQAIRFLRDTGQRCFQERIRQLEAGEDCPVDVLTLAIKAAETDKGFDLEALLDDFVTFFIAGQETTAITLSFTVMELGRHPDVLERLREEVQEQIGDKEVITYEDVSKLEYMNMVLRESLRLYPPSPMTFRKTLQTQDIGGYTMPSGTTVLLSTYISSRLEQFFPDHTTFDPERFNPNNEIRPSLYACYPFSIGHRNCVGQQFAQLEAKIILSKFIREFDFVLDSDQSLEAEQIATLRPKGEVTCFLCERSTPGGGHNRPGSLY